jgi:hypothetical protein
MSRVAVYVAYRMLLLLEMVVCTEHRRVEDQRIVACGRLLDRDQQVVGALATAREPHLHSNAHVADVNSPYWTEDHHPHRRASSRVAAHLSLAAFPGEVALGAIGINVHVEALLGPSTPCLLQVVLSQSLLVRVRCRSVVVAQEEFRGDCLPLLVELPHVLVVAQLVRPPSLRVPGDSDRL